MEIRLCDEATSPAWDDFVNKSRECCHYHLYGWKHVVERSYGHKCPYLICLQGGDVTGILPSVIVTSRIFGRSLTSLPFLDVAGVVAVDASSCAALVARAELIAREHRLAYLELRQSSPVAGPFEVDSHKVGMVLPLQKRGEALWNSLPPERRNRVRRAMAATLSVHFVSTEALGEFYAVWSHNMRDLGSPAHSRHWFQHTLSEFQGSTGIILIRHGAVAVGAAIWIEFKGRLAVPWVSSIKEHFAKHPNDLLYWEAIRFAAEKECTEFDFGRSTRNSGHYTYKKRWGASEQPLHWHYQVLEPERARLPKEADQRYGLAMRIWGRLPLAVANIVGPRVRKYITS